MPETPKKVGAKVDNAIHHLNAFWDLQLPRLHGGAAEAAESTSALAQRCAARLRYLSFRLDSLDTITEDFDVRARQLYASWTFKPRQENGTLPQFPVTKSNLDRDVNKRRVLGLNKLTHDQRQKLLKLLDTTLEDDYKLARENDEYRRTSASPSRANSTHRLFPRNISHDQLSTSAPIQADNAPSFRQPAAKMTKRRSADDSSADKSKRKKPDDISNQSTLLGFLYQPAASRSAPALHPGIQRSFDTNVSSSASDIFDTPRLSATSSADTSILDDDLNTQEAEDLLQDDAVRRSIEPATSLSTSFSINDLPYKLESTFAIANSFLPPNLPFQYLYELQSIALSWNSEPIKIFKEVEKRCRATVPSPDQRLKTFKQLRREGDLPPFENFGSQSWTPSCGLAPGKENYRSTYLTASLTWTTKPSDPKIFNTRLKGPVTDKSCRFHRIFGGDRFLVLQVPFIQWSDLPDHLRTHVDNLHDSLVNWLVSEHSIAGRKWRPFWVDDKPPKPMKGKSSFNKVHLFAVSGIGLSESAESIDRQPISIEEFIDRHAPIKHNLNSTNLKLFARFKLGLSKTTPTVILDQTQFRHKEDVIGDDGKSVMNDGCAMMSVPLAREISRQLGLDEIPSAIQGRIGGAKGLWVADHRDLQTVDSSDYWIEISPSQLKIHPHPKERDACDEYRRFEVTAWSGPAHTPALNTQFITVLKDRGVPRSVLEDCLNEQIQTYSNDLDKAMADSRSLRSWLHENHPTPRDDEIEQLGSLPRGRNEEINCLLDAGFNGQDCHSPLRDLLSVNLREHLSWWVEKAKITIKEESTFLFCVADPYHVLEEGEVHLSLSRGWTNPLTGVSRNYVADVDGLVARNPANLPSDIQRIRFVFKRELETFRDILIFPSKGKRSLASLLSGGDYDGDQCWACWHPKIVQNFVNYAPGPPDEITSELCGLNHRAQSLSTILSTDELNAYSVSAFLHSCIDFNIKPSMLGICTNEHEKLVYHKSLRHPGAINLGALASFLVDARKQGLELTEKSFTQVRLECSGRQQLANPAFKASDTEAPSKWKDSNIMDYLRFKVASPRRHEILQRFHQKWPREVTFSPLLASTWTKACDLARGHQTSDQTLQKLKQDIQDVYANWQRLTGGSKFDVDPGQFPQRVLDCYEKYENIAPLVLPDTETHFNLNFEAEKDQPFSYWKNLKASCFYSAFWKTRLTWHMGGAELCVLQAAETGNLRIMTAQMYAVTKVDTKAIKSRVATIEEGDEKKAGDMRPDGTIDRFFGH